MSQNKKMTNKKTKNKNKKKKFKVVMLTLLFMFLTTIVVGSAVFLGMIKTAPEINVSMITSLNEPTKFYDNKGKVIDEYLTTERRDPVEFKEIPKNLSDAFVSIEDERFYKHHGLDYKRLAGATLSNFKNLLKGKRNFQGGSTITQQLIKQRYFLEQSLSNRLSIERKIQEMYLSTQLEKKVSKEKILETYMNTIPLGGSAYGVKSAARQYFNKDLKDLTLTECAFIASCAQSPSVSYGAAKYSFDKNQIHESPRTQAVLKKMLEGNYISNDEYEKALKPQLKYALNNKTKNKMNYEWFSRPVIDEVIKDLKSKYNYSDNEVNSLLAYGGLKIYTTMDTELQKKSKEILDDSSSNEKTRSWQYIFPRKGNLEPVQPNLQASATIIDYRTGEVKAIIGGRGEQGPLSYNRAASSKFLRAPGSAIKPLTVFAPAIDSKIATAGTVFEDSPLSNDLANLYGAKGKPYQPKNASRTFAGYMPLREAIRVSSNLVSVKLTHEVSLKTSALYGEKFGLQLDDQDKKSIAALALGQLDSGQYNGTNPLTLSAAYGVFGNNGNIVRPRVYTKVLDRTGKNILETKTQSNKVLSPEAAYIMYDMLKEPVSPGGTGRNANFEGMSVRGKTGTSSNGKDLWFSGLTPYYSATVWVGNDDNSDIQGGIYSSTVGKLWSRIMQEAHKNLQDKDIPRPSNIVESKVSMDSGTLPSELSYKDPRGSRVYTELFIKGTEPTTYDNVHVSASVVDKGNRKYVLASSSSNPRTVQQRVFIKRDYTPSAYLKDQPYVLPKAYDDSKFQITNIDTSNKDKEKNKEKEKEKDNPNQGNPTPDTTQNQTPPSTPVNPNSSLPGSEGQKKEKDKLKDKLKKAN
ncbi:transglycosylase domain-containing protein [Hathewaya histolytica]|uniref:Penicillin-binding protein 1A n=1 Tax=Hathewaya histolytica TaxID=1498 RepID=A0A4U9RMG7_HATHI|nr:PBP1A family penicillin-binding protein [Hathewaya histolytica]VTQ92611.1 multimodular transpeptidase-transglycosylase [Hathewaya histolytica]